MYQLLVFYPEEPLARVTVGAARAAQALDLIPQLLAAHEGCEHIVVMLSGVRLFAVDCAGNRLP